MSQPRQLSIEGASLLEDIQARGMALVNHHIPDEQIDRLIGAYTLFTTSHPDPEPATMSAMLPNAPPGELSKQLDELDRRQDQQAEWHKYRTNHPMFDKPGGYSNRSFQTDALLKTRGIELQDDPKEYYHYTPAGLNHIQDQHREHDWGNLPPELIRLHAAFSSIHTAAIHMMHRIIANVEDVHPQISRFITPASLHVSPLRLLFYHPGQAEHMGAVHYDKSTWTIQIAESHQGLRVATPNQEQLLLVQRPPEKAVVFPGTGLKAARPNTPFEPGWHDVVKLDELNNGRSIPPKAQEVCARWAIIFFANSINFVQPDKTLMHVR